MKFQDIRRKTAVLKIQKGEEVKTAAKIESAMAIAEIEINLNEISSILRRK